jgi:hypothetical protein
VDPGAPLGWICNLSNLLASLNFDTSCPPIGIIFDETLSKENSMSSPSGTRKVSSSKSKHSGVIKEQAKPTVAIDRGVGDVWTYSDYQRLRSAKEAIKALMDAKAEAEAQLEDCFKKMEDEQGMLDSYLASAAKSTPAGKQGIKACRLGVKAWKMSIKAFSGDIEYCVAEINSIKNGLPVEFQAYLPDGVEEPDYPLVQVNKIPNVVESLRNGMGYPRYAVLMFLPSDSNDDDYVNLQYSFENDTIGLDWVLLGERNIDDKKAIIAFTKKFGYKFERYEMNKVKYLRIECHSIEELAKIGVKIISDFYGFDPTFKIKLLVEGFNWRMSNESC